MIWYGQELVLYASSIACGRAGLVKLDLGSDRVILVD